MLPATNTWLLALLQLLSSLVVPAHSLSPSVVPPPPPWSFEAARIYYTFLSVPTEVACKCIPTNSQDDKLCLLSIGGQTLGGLFAIEYENSPIGPYKEIAVLAGLVTEKTVLGIPNLLKVGAWASHIFVNLEDAAVYGKKFWGLPASVVPIDFEMPEMNNTSHAPREIDAYPSFVFSDSFDGVGVAGWTTSGRASQTQSSASSPIGGLFDITLPSYSGRLSPTTDPLLRYPLTISNLGMISGSRTNNMPMMKNVEDIDENLMRLLQESTPLFSVEIDGGATLIAGIPEILSSSKEG